MTDTRNSDLTYAAGDVIGFLAPFPTADPGNMSALSSPWLCMGWIDTTGTIFKLAEAQKAINAAGTLDPIRTIVTAAPKTFDVTLMEGANPVARALFDDVPISDLQPASSTTIASYLMPEVPSLIDYALVFDSFDGDKMLRTFMPQAKVTSRGQDQQQQADATMLQVTFTAYPQLIGGTRSAMKRYINYGDADLTAFYA